MHVQVSLRLSILTAVFITVLSLGVTPSWTQNPAAPHDQKPTAPDDTDTEVVPTDRLHRTVAENTAEAWTTLTNALQDPKHPDVRIQALAALGTLGNNARAENLITAAMKAPDFDVRTAAILAAG